MSVLIKDMEMPKSCLDCCLCDYYKRQWYCHAINDLVNCGTENGRKRSDNCPFVEVPSHGRLIDADALMKSVEKWLPSDTCGREEKEYPFETDICVSMLMEIEEQPTIIPADKDGDT